MAKVTMYSRGVCPYCEAARSLLKRRGIDYEEISLTGDEAQFAELMKKSGMRTVPQIFHGDELIGGFQELNEQDQKDQLESLK